MNYYCRFISAWYVLAIPNSLDILPSRNQTWQWAIPCKIMQFPIFLSIQNKNIIYLYIYIYLIIYNYRYTRIFCPWPGWITRYEAPPVLLVNWFFRPAEWFPKTAEIQRPFSKSLRKLLGSSHTLAVHKKAEGVTIGTWRQVGFIYIYIENALWSFNSLLWKMVIYSWFTCWKRWFSIATLNHQKVHSRKMPSHRDQQSSWRWAFWEGPLC